MSEAMVSNCLIIWQAGGRAGMWDIRVHGTCNSNTRVRSVLFLASVGFPEAGLYACAGFFASCRQVTELFDPERVIRGVNWVVASGLDQEREGGGGARLVGDQPTNRGWFPLSQLSWASGISALRIPAP